MHVRTIDELIAAIDEAGRRNDVDALEACAVECEQIDTPEARALSALTRGSVDKLRRNILAAIEHLRQALAMYTDLEDRPRMASTAANLCLAMYDRSDFDEAAEYGRQALALHEALGDKRSMANDLLNIGNAFYSTGQQPLALEHFHRALAIREELGDVDAAASLYGSIGNVYNTVGNYPRALEHFFRALAAKEQGSDRIGLARVIGNIGVVYENTGDNEKAMEYKQRALALREEIGDVPGIAFSVGSLGGLLATLARYSEALEMDLRALALYRSLDNREGVARTLSNIVFVHIHANAFEEAEAVLQELETITIQQPLVAFNRILARAVLQQFAGQLDEAVDTFRRSLLFAEERALPPSQAVAHRYLRDLCQLRNDFAGYIEHNDHFTRITEEINGKDTTAKLAMQEAERKMAAERQEHEKHLAVLHSTLPKEVAERVARGEVVNDHFDNATVIFLDIVGFTEISSSMSSQVVIELLDDVFTQCDAICAKHGVTKIKTIGDSYMAVAFDNVVNAALCASEFNRIQYTIQNTESNPRMLQYRIGVHCGPVTAGVIGKERMQYDVWGDTVNVASRMESAGEAGKVHVTEAVAANLKSNTEYTIQNSITESGNSESHEVSHSVSHSVSHAVQLVTGNSSLVTIERGSIDIKGKGAMNTYWLESE